MTLEDLLEKKINIQKEAGCYRSLIVGDPGLLDFTSNDYLGLAKSAELKHAIEAGLSDQQKLNGSTGSRLLSGNSKTIEDIEIKLASIFKSDSTLIFNSGYTANLAILSSIPDRHDTILYDEYAHASIKDGARLSLAKRMSFRHNDLNDLEAKLKKVEGSAFVVVESIYSMDGDECPLESLVSLSELYGATLILDEAHATGVIGPGGAGMAVSMHFENRIGIRVHTFGKAMGIHGACVAGSAKLQKYLVNFARPFIYTTAPDMHSVVAIEESFNHLAKNQILQTELNDRIRIFVTAMQGCEQLIPSKSSIQGFVVSGNENVRSIANYLQRRRFDVRPILSPTVALGRERIRICLHTFNSVEEIKSLATELKALSKSDFAPLIKQLS
ncbi:MAG: 8-amino-7-oxononanoate synthase [Chryseolinea sp.]